MLGSSFNTSMHLSRVETFQPQEWGKHRDKGQRLCLMPSGGHRSSWHCALQETVLLQIVSWKDGSQNCLCLKYSQHISGYVCKFQTYSAVIVGTNLIFFNIYIFLIFSFFFVVVVAGNLLGPGAASAPTHSLCEPAQGRYMFSRSVSSFSHPPSFFGSSAIAPHLSALICFRITSI